MKLGLAISILFFVFFVLYNISVGLHNKGVRSHNEKIRTMASSCEGLSPEIIKLSDEQEEQVFGKILTLHDVKELALPKERTDEVRDIDWIMGRKRKRTVNCIAIANWSNGISTTIQFYAEESKSGTVYFGYEGG